MIAKHIDRFPLLKLDQVIDWQPIEQYLNCQRTRIDFNLFCRFDELSIPDYSTLCRYRNWLAQDNTLSELLKLINRQLTEKGLKIEKASAAVVDATIIQTASTNSVRL